MKLHLYYDTEALILAYTQYFQQLAAKYIQEQGQFNVVLSGGSSPKLVYELLASAKFCDKIDWQNIYFFFGDERYVPANDAQSNALMVEKALFQPLHIAADHIFKMNTALSPEETAKTYMNTINAHFGKLPIQFDFIMLGLGDDAHTASLFPQTPVLKEKQATVRAVFLTAESTYRITLTAPLINQAKNIAFLVFGENKAAAVQKVIDGAKNYEQFPAQLIQPINGELHWFLDEDAGNGLKKVVGSFDY